MLKFLLRRNEVEVRRPTKLGAQNQNGVACGIITHDECMVVLHL